MAGAGTVVVYGGDFGSRIDFAAAVDSTSHIAFAPDGASMVLLTADAGGMTLARLSRLTGALTTRRHLSEGRPAALSLLADGSTVVASTASAGTDATAGYLTVVAEAPDDPAVISVPVCTAPLAGMHYWEDGREVFVACEDGTLVEVDARLWLVVRTVPALDVTCDPRGLTMSANGTVVMVLCASGSLMYLDRLRLATFDSVAVGAGGVGVARTPDGRHALIPFPNDGVVAVVGLRDQTVQRRLAIRGPRHVTASGDGRTAYVVSHATPDSTEVVAIDLRSLEVVRRAPAPAGAREVALWPGWRSPTMRWYAAAP